MPEDIFITGALGESWKKFLTAEGAQKQLFDMLISALNELVSQQRHESFRLWYETKKQYPEFFKDGSRAAVGRGVDRDEVILRQYKE